MTDRAALNLAGGPYRLGVIGDPVAHSLSPAFQQAALDELRIPATYERWQTRESELAGRIESLRLPQMLGANVTVPHKVAAMRLVDEVSPAAQRAGAVNTIVNRRGWLIGDNTDIYGFRTSVAAALAADSRKTAVVLGAGGAARAVVLALEELGVEVIVVANRDMERGARLAADLAPAPVRLVSNQSDDLTLELPRCGLLVNATSLGWRAGETPVDLELIDLLPSTAVVADLTYRDTDLLNAATARSMRAIDGLAMLVHQGARAFELFTGFPPPLATMWDAARRARSGT